MVSYASKDLIHRAAVYDKWDHLYEGHPPESYKTIIRDLAKAAPEPEPRASSALLEAARNLVDDIERGSWDAVDPIPVRAAIEAEEARGPSEVEKLRRELASVTSERDELDAKYLGFEKTLSAIQDCQPTPARFREDDQLEPPWEVVERIWCNLNAAEVRAEKAEAERDAETKRGDGLRSDVTYWQDIVMSAVAACGYPGLLHSELVAHIKQLPKERDEAIARAEQQAAEIGSLCKRLSEAGITDVEALRKDLAEVQGRNRRQYDAIRELRKELDQERAMRLRSDATMRAAETRAEKVEAEVNRLQEAVVDSGSNAKLLELRNWLESDCDDPVTHDALANKIGFMLFRPPSSAAPSSVASVDTDDGPLRRWLTEHGAGFRVISPENDQLALAELCRRALGGG